MCLLCPVGKSGSACRRPDRSADVQISLRHHDPPADVRISLQTCSLLFEWHFSNLKILQFLHKLDAGVVLALDKCCLGSRQLEHLKRRLGQQTPEPRVRILLDKALRLG